MKGWPALLRQLSRRSGGCVLSRGEGVSASLTEEESLQIICLRNGATDILGERSHIRQGIWVDVAIDHPRRENVAYLVEPQMVRRTRFEPNDRVADDHAIGLAASRKPKIAGALVACSLREPVVESDHRHALRHSRWIALLKGQWYESNPHGVVTLLVDGRRCLQRLLLSSRSGHRLPCPHSFAAKLAKCLTADQVTLNVEGIVDGGVC